MPQCPQCKIDRQDISSTCLICGCAPAQPAAGRSPAQPSKRKYPVIIASSPLALCARTIKWGLLLLVVLAFAVIASAKGMGGGSFLFRIFSVGLAVLLVKVWFGYLRIKNTQYRIYQNKIEAASYLFRFMGVYNNTVNLAQLRQVQSSTNSFLDLWFFKCGSVSITVSGDVADFRIKDVHYPSAVRKVIEEIVFGAASVTKAQNHTFDEVGEG